MVDHHGDLRGTPNEVAAGMKGDDLGKTRELVKVRLWVRDFASPDAHSLIWAGGRRDIPFPS